MIIDGSWPEMAWGRWSAWTKEDPRWDTYVLDTTGRSIVESVDDLERWVMAQRIGQLALSKGWACTGA